MEGNVVKIENETNSLAILLKTLNRPYDNWARFIAAVEKKENYNYNLPYWYRLENILDELSYNEKAMLIQNLMQIRNFNPLQDIIPMNEIPDLLKPRLKEIINTLYVKYIKYTNAIKSGNVFLAGEEEKGLCLGLATELDLKGLPHFCWKNNLFHLVIVRNPQLKDVVISSHPFIKPHILLDELYYILNSLEEDVWYLHGTKRILLTKDNKTSSFTISDLINKTKKYIYFKT